jgi:hypothetical protein
MSTEKITKSFLFYVIPLCLLLSYIFTACYGDELDIVEDRLNTVETKLKEIQDKINEGFIVKSVTNKPNGDKPGFEIIIVDGNGNELDPWWIYGGADGASGANGANGRDAAQWSIVNGVWVSTDWQGTQTVTGIPARGSQSPEIKDGRWVFYTWDDDCRCYDTIPTSYKADSLSTYIVDLGEYYELFVPIQEKDPSGQFVVNPDGTPKWIIQRIKLPKWLTEFKPPVYFRILGYATVVGTDSLKILDRDLSLNYWYIDSLYNHTEGTMVTHSDDIWKWDLNINGGPPYMQESEFIIPQLQNDNIAVVFSLNKPQSYMNALDPLKLRLYDSKDRKLELIQFEQPVLLDRLLTKGGSNGDTIYYARMKNESYPPLASANVPKGNIYYRLILESGDSIRSELASSTIAFSRYTIIPEELDVYPAVTGSTLIVPDTFQVQSSSTLSRIVSISPLIPGDTGKIYGYYIDSLKGGGLLPHVTFGTPPISFKVDSPTTGQPDYEFLLGIYKLQMNGAIYIDTIKIKAVP